MERRGTLTERKSVGRRVVLFVCNERRIVKVVRRVAWSEGCSVFVLGRKSGNRLWVCPPKKGRWRRSVPDAEDRLSLFLFLSLYILSKV